jgi:N-acetylneuraminic acid mutarotase
MQLVLRRRWGSLVLRWLLVLAALLALPRAAFAQAASWSAAPNMVFARNTPVAVASGGLLYAVSMTSSGSTVESFDPSTNGWTLKASNGPLAADVNGTLYAAWINVGDSSAVVSKYNVGSNSWSAVSTSPAGLGGSQMVAIGSELFFVTRYSRPVQSSPFTIGLHVYDTVANTWTVEVGQFQGAEERQDTTAVALNNKLYFVGGKPYSAGFATDRLLEYDPAAGTWTAKASLPVPIARAGATALGGKLYVVGGQTGVDTVENATQVYDAATNTWSTVADLPTARFGLGVASLAGAIYALGGNTGTTAVNTVEKLTLPTTAYYRIKNRWQGTYLHTENLTGFVQVGGINGSWLSAQWSLEDSGQGYFRVKNRWTGKYIHIENLTGKLQYGDILPSWDSAKWFFDNFNGYKRIRSAWQANQFAHIENLTGSAQYGAVYDTWQSAQWTLEAVP